MGGVIPSEAFNTQIVKTVRETLRRSRGPDPRQGRWHKRGGKFKARWELWMQTCGLVPSGSIDLDVTYRDGASTETGTATIDFDNTAAEIKTEIEGLSELISGLVVKGGPFDQRSLVIASATITDIALNTNNLVNAIPYLRYRYTEADLEPEDA